MRPVWPVHGPFEVHAVTQTSMAEQNLPEHLRFTLHIVYLCPTFGALMHQPGAVLPSTASIYSSIFAITAL